MKDYLRVGVIANTHGIKGEAKVFPTTDDSRRFKSLKTVFADTGSGTVELEIETVRFFKQMVILKFKGIDTIESVEKYKGKDLLITREQAVPLKEDEYFIYDIIGADVDLIDGGRLGTLVEVLVTGANDVYVVETEEKKELLIPVIKACVKSIDIEKKRVLVDPLPGLLD